MLLVKIYPILKAPGWSDWVSRPIPSWGGRHAEQTSDEIQLTHIYCNEEKATVWITPRFRSF
jgi:hypothetical protein